MSLIKEPQDTSIDGEKYVRQTGHVLESQIDDEKVLFDTRSGQTFGLSPVATVIWELLIHPTDLNSLCRSLMEAFDVSPEKCREETKALLDRLAAKGLVVSQ